MLSQKISQSKELPFMDDTDTLGSFMAALPKDTSNIIQGVINRVKTVFRFQHMASGSMFLTSTQPSTECGPTALSL